MLGPLEDRRSEFECLSEGAVEDFVFLGIDLLGRLCPSLNVFISSLYGSEQANSPQEASIYLSVHKSLRLEV